MATHSSFEEISPTGEKKSYSLKPSYAAGQAELCCIHAYNAVDAERKHAFHQDALRYLRRIGAHLRASGVTYMSCESNPAGIAVSGEVYARYLHPDKRLALFLTLEPLQWGEPQSDRDDCLAIRVEQELFQRDMTARASKAKKPTVYVHTVPARRPPCYLNANHSSEITARCLLTLLESPPIRSIACWEWLPDGHLLAQEHYADALVQRKEAQLRAKNAQQGQWQTIVPSKGEHAYQLADTYLAPMGSRLLYRGLEQPRMSHGGEQVFLQCDFERDARRFLCILGACLIAGGYQEQRIIEQDHQMVTRGEYRRSADPESVKLVVHLGAITNTDVAQRHDHLLIAAFLHSQDAEEETQGLPLHLGPPIHLSAGAYAEQLLAALKRPLMPAEQAVSPSLLPTHRSQKPRRNTRQPVSPHDQWLFF